ncbi:PTS system mannose/fructose/sorbose family transporter subunit IID [Lactobacillus sp. R2/2]|nr:PTS system mannose/fructose/sorbose family transporter subunit IID [Lactobacillus sp. R2/2]
MANVVGLMVVGALISTVIKVKTPLKIVVHSNVSNKVGGNVISLQSMFDKIMPGLLSLLVTVLVYYILKKTNGKHAAMLIIAMMVVVVGLTYFKIL